MKTATKFILATLTAGVLVIAPARANLLVNGSFESGTNPGSSFITLTNGDSTDITGWTVIGDSVDYIGGYWQAADGVRSLDLNGLNSGGVQQTFATVAGQEYKVTFALAGNPDGSPADKTLITTTVGGVNSFNFNVVTAGSTHANMEWTTESFDFTAIASSTLLSFVSTTGDSPYGPALDAVDVECVPEPSSMALMAGGILGLFFVVRSRSRMTA
jgi:choice-of-anchor C domain-containing protein